MTEPIRDEHEEKIEAVFADESVPVRARELINALLTYAENIEEERDEAIEDADTLREQIEQRDSDQDAALEAIKYWLHDALNFKKLTTDPLKMLQLVERAL